MVMQGRQISNSDLIIALTDACRGSASEWLSSIIQPSLSWDTFKTLFITKYCLIETPAATLFQAINRSPKDGDVIKLTNDLIVSLQSVFRNRLPGELMLLLIGGLIAQFEPDLRRWIFTRESFTEVELLQELRAIRASKAARTVPSIEKGSDRVWRSAPGRAHESIKRKGEDTEQSQRKYICTDYRGPPCTSSVSGTTSRPPTTRAELPELLDSGESSEEGEEPVVEIQPSGSQATWNY